MIIDISAEIHTTGRIASNTMKLIYKPFGLIFGILAGFLAKKLFEAVWGIFDKEEPPKPTTQQTTWPKVIGAAVVRGRDLQGHARGGRSRRRQGLCARSPDSGPARRRRTRASRRGVRPQPPS